MTFQFFATPELLPETTIIPIADNEHRPEKLRQILEHPDLNASHVIEDFKAGFCEILPLYSGTHPIFLLGLGKKESLVDLLKAFRTLSFRKKDVWTKNLALNFFYLSETSDLSYWIEAAVNGIYLGKYQVGKFKTEANGDISSWSEHTVLKIQVPEDAMENADQAARKGLEMGRTQESVMDLVNAPSNKKTPSDLANWALRSGEKYGYRVDILDMEAIKQKGLHALLAVNRGSESPPAFIIMEYRAEGLNNQLPKIGLIGKGVTFDTGGVSMKPSANMHYMKSDMGGAAAVFGTMEMAAKLKLPIHLIGIVPATDNCVDAKAIKPGDVIGSYSGKTIEVIDTDAEGRLILADGIAYALRHFQPDVLIDLATLTGSTVRTLGYHAAALFTNNEELFDRLQAVTQTTGERFWRLPLWDVYSEDVKSDVADVRNYSGRPLAGAIGAAKFLEVFTEDHPAWAHLDIAGVAFTDSEFSSQKSATAYGVRLLIAYLTGLIRGN